MALYNQKTYCLNYCICALVGNGKTHYIKKLLYGLQPYLIIAVNESFTPLNAILKLRSLPRDKCCKIYFNFTIVVSINCITTALVLQCLAT